MSLIERLGARGDIDSSTLATVSNSAKQDKTAQRRKAAQPEKATKKQPAQLKRKRSAASSARMQKTASNGSSECSEDLPLRKQPSAALRSASDSDEDIPLATIAKRRALPAAAPTGALCSYATSNVSHTAYYTAMIAAQSFWCQQTASQTV